MDLTTTENNISGFNALNTYGPAPSTDYTGNSASGIAASLRSGLLSAIARAHAIISLFGISFSMTSGALQLARVRSSRGQGTKREHEVAV